jgi:hypothetical protein
MWTGIDIVGCGGRRNASVAATFRGEVVQLLLYLGRRLRRARSAREQVIARVEATALGTDVRFIVTNLAGRSKVLYE